MCVYVLPHHQLVLLPTSAPASLPRSTHAPLEVAVVVAGVWCLYLPCHLLGKFFLIASPLAFCLFFAYASSSFFRSFCSRFSFWPRLPFPIFRFPTFPLSILCRLTVILTFHAHLFVMLFWPALTAHKGRGRGKVNISLFCIYIYKCVCIHRNSRRAS